jgi:UDP-glucose 4-epimerase
VKTLVTGAAGFIGSNLVDRLLAAGHSVVGFDNFSTGSESFLDGALSSPKFHLVRGNLLDSGSIIAAMEGIDLVFHLAANADVRFGTNHPTRDLEQNTICTSNLLEAMRVTGSRRIVFASTGSVYGEPRVFPTAEDAAFPVQTSLYGASKLACEGLIAAYCEGFGFRSHIFRFVSILGERYTHGHIYDFYNQLLNDPTRLKILGNGHQRKSYLYVQDCLDAILIALEKANEKVNVFNLGTDEYCEVNDSVSWILQHLGLTPKLEYTGGERGWVGDSPFIFLDCSRIQALGWKPKLSIRQGVIRTVNFLMEQPHLLERHSETGKLTGRRVD